MTHGGLIHGCVGDPEIGKTTLLRAKVYAELARPAGWGFAVLDPNEEFGAGSPRPYKLLRDPSRVGRARADSRLVIVRPRTVGEATPEFAEAMARQCVTGPPTILVLPEAHEVVPNGAGPVRLFAPTIKTILLRARHRKIASGIWWDSQYLRDVATELRNPTTVIYFFATGGQQDVKAIRGYGGAPLLEAIHECGRRALGKSRHNPGVEEKGWHVRVRPLEAALGSYALRRIAL